MGVAFFGQPAKRCMDRKIEVSKRKKHWRHFMWAGGALLLVAAVYLLSGAGGKYRLEREKIRTAVVQQKRFDDEIAVQGSVEPQRSFFLDAVEGGTVQEIFVEAGEMVEEGQPLLRLSNTQLMLDFMNRETQIVEQINNLRNTRMQMELTERNIRGQVLDIAFEKEKMERQFSIDTSLYASNVIARQQYEDSYTRYQYLVKKEKLLQSAFQKDEAYRELQMGRIDQSIDMMERNLAAIRSNLENLTVKAPVAGQLTSFEAEIGESKMKGENLGRIDVLDGYVIKALVDEHYLSRVKPGQQARFRLGSDNYKLQVSKVLPEVRNNQFVVEFEFRDSVPANIRRGQSLPIRLSLSNSVEAVLVPRGAFFSSSGGKWVYVINGNEAHRRQVQMGRQNPGYIEVLSGLEPGEEIITSSYDTYSDYEELRLEN